MNQQQQIKRIHEMYDEAKFSFYTRDELIELIGGNNNEQMEQDKEDGGEDDRSIIPEITL